MTNPLLRLKAHGQSVWYDNIDRAQLLSGLFQQLIDEDGIVGATANPTIFEQSISRGSAYDEQIQKLLHEGKNTKEIYEALVMTDVRLVADKLRQVYEQTNRRDGFVSLEVSPDLAHDTEGTLAERRRFCNTVDRHNLLVKIPATPGEGRGGHTLSCNGRWRSGCLAAPGRTVVCHFSDLSPCRRPTG